MDEKNAKYNDYKIRFAKENYKRVPLDLKKEKYEQIKAAAEQRMQRESN